MKNVAIFASKAARDNKTCHGEIASKPADKRANTGGDLGKILRIKKYVSKIVKTPKNADANLVENSFSPNTLTGKTERYA